MNPITRMMKRYIKTPLKYAFPLLFIGALVLISTTGCVSQTGTNQADITSYPQAGQHSKLVEAFAEQDKPSVSGYTHNVQWLNDTTAQVTNIWTSGGTQFTDIHTYAQFPTIDAATAYFYSLQSTYPLKDPYNVDMPHYSDVTGHDPTVIRALYSDASHELFQTDNVVSQMTWSTLDINQA